MAITHDSTARVPTPIADPAPIRAPSLDELETLVTCAAEGSLASAATVLSISRPAVAKRLANLEALAGCPLLRRAGHGVTLTNAGAKLVAATPPIFHQREILLALLAEIRNEGEHSARMRELLGHTPTATRAAQKPEARLATAERLLEFIVGASSSAIVLCDAVTSGIEEANRAFCSFTGRSRPELLRVPLEAAGVSLAGVAYDELVERLAQDGPLEGLGVRSARSDGSVLAATASARVVGVAGAALLALVIDESPPA